MNVYRWLNPVTGDWQTGADWDVGSVPDSATAAVSIDVSGSYEVTIAAGESETAGTVTLNAFGASLNVAGTLNAASGVAVQAGTLVLAGAVNGAVTVESGGVLVESGTGAFVLAPQILLDGGTATFLNTQSGTAEVSVAAGSTVQATGVIPDATQYQPSGHSGTAAVALTNDGTVMAATTIGSELFVAVSDFANAGLLETANALLISGVTFDNQASGTIDGLAGADITVYSAFSNEGLITLAAGTLDVATAGTWINTGTIVAAGGAVLLSGDETLADLGSIELSGGALLALNGTLENAGGTLDGTTGLLQGAVLDGTIKGGTLDAAALGLSFGYGATLDGVTVINGLTLAAGVVTLDDGTTVFAGAAGGAPAAIAVQSGATLSLAGSNAFNIGNDITSSGGGLALSGPFTLTGSITAQGGTVQLGDIGGGDSWTNAGLVSMTGGELDLSGVETLAQIGSLALSGTTLAYLRGTLENAGGTLGSASVLHGITLEGITIQGGTLDAPGFGAVFGVPTGGIFAAASLGQTNFASLPPNFAAANTLDGVSVINGLTLGLGSVVLTDGSAVYADATAQNLATIEVTGTQYGNTGTIGFTGTGGYVIDQPLSVDGGVAVLGGAFTLETAIAMTSGTVALGGPAGSAVASWTNLGTVTATGGTVTLNGDETVAQIGALVLTGATLDFVGGTLENAGGTLNAADTSLRGLVLDGATIEGGVLDGAGFAPGFGGAQSPNVLDNVTVLNDLTAEGDVALSGSTTVLSGAAGSGAGTITVGNAGRLDLVGAGPATLADDVVLADGELSWVAGFGTLAASLAVTIAAGTTVSGSGSISDDSAYPTTLSLTNDGTIAANASGNELQINVDGFVNAGTLTAGGGGILAVMQGGTGAAWSNTGTISANGAQNVILGGGLANSGSIAVNGGSLFIGSQFQTYDPTTQLYSEASPSWTNTGTITVTNATLLLEGDETAADLGTIQRSGGALYFVGGTLANAGVTLDGSQTALAGLQLSGGTIEGGTVDAAALGFGVGGYNNGTPSGLDNVAVIGGFTVAGQLNVTGSTAVYADAGETTPGGVTLSTGGVLAFGEAGPQTLVNNVLLQGGTLTWSVFTSVYTAGTPYAATIGAGVSVSGAGGIADQYAGAVDSLTNDGTILADSPGFSLTVAVATLDNLGLMEASNAGTLTIGGPREIVDPGTGVSALGYPTFLNGGTIEANHGVVALQGDETVAQLGTIIDNQGTVEYAGGTLDNAGGTLNAATTSLIGVQFTGGAIEGGTLDQLGLGLGFVAGTQSTLDNVAVIDGLSVSGFVALSGSSAVYADAAAAAPGTITVSDGQVGFVGGATATLVNDVSLNVGDLTWLNNAAGSVGVSTVTIAAGVMVSGAGQLEDASYFNSQSGTDDVTNLGTIASSGFDAQFSINLTRFTNAGTLLAGAASTLAVVAANFTNLSGGTLTGGTYIAQSEATLAFDQTFFTSATITTLAADLVFTGIGAYSLAESSITQIAASGVLEVDAGASVGGANALGISGNLLLGGGTLVETGVEVFAGATLSGNGAVTAAGGITLDTSVLASGGTLVLGGPVSGAGTVDVAAGAAAELSGASANSVSLNGAASTVVLGTPAAYSGEILGFVAGDSILLGGFDGTAANFSNGLLVVSNGGAAVTLDVAGGFAANAFAVSIPQTGTTLVQLAQGQTLSVAAPAALLDHPGTVVAVGGVSVADVAGATLTVTVASQYGLLSASPEDGGVAQGNGTGTLILTGALAAVNAELATLAYRAPAAGQFTDSLVLTATDATSGAASGLINVTVDQPLAITAPTQEFAPVGAASALAGLSLAKPDVFAGETITVTLTDTGGALTATASGAATVGGNGTTHLVLTGALADVNAELATVGFDGTANDQVTIVANDGRGGLSAALLPVYVNLPPAITAPGTASGIFGATIPVQGISVADPYGVAAGDNFTVVLGVAAGTLSLSASAGATVTGSGTASVTLSGTLPAIDSELGTLRYGAGANGAGGAANDTLSIAVSDGQGENSSANVAIAVAADVAPSLQAPAGASVTALASGTLGAIGLSDSDAVAASKIFTVQVSDATGILQGTASGAGSVSGSGSASLTLTGDLTDINAELAGLTYTGAIPGQAANATAGDTVTLQASDGDGGTGTAAIAVTIGQIPYAPPALTVPGGARLAAGTPTTIAGVAIGDAFAQATGAVLTVSLSDLTGTLAATASGGGGVVGSGSSQIILTGDLADINAELAGLTYTGAAPDTALSESASDTITLQAQDGRGGASAQQQIVVTVDPSAALPYGNFLNAADALTTLASADPSATAQIAQAALAVYAAGVSGAIGTVGGTVWQGAYDASSRQASTVGADIAVGTAATTLLDDGLSLLGTVVSGTLGAIASNGTQAAYDAVAAAAATLATDIAGGASQSALLGAVSGLYAAIAAADGGTLGQAQWQNAVNGSAQAANALATAVSEGAPGPTLLGDAANLYDTMISGSLTAIGGAALAQAYTGGGATIVTLASDINNGAGSPQIFGDLGTIYNSTVVGTLTGAGIATNAATTPGSSAGVGYGAAIGASNALLGTIGSGGSAVDLYHATSAIFISALPSGLGTQNNATVQAGLGEVTIIQTALQADIAILTPQSQDPHLQVVGNALLTAALGPQGNTGWQAVTTAVTQAASADAPAITGHTANAQAAESDLLSKAMTAFLEQAEAESALAAQTINAALTALVNDESGNNSAQMLADLGTLFSALLNAAATAGSPVNATNAVGASAQSDGTEQNAVVTTNNNPGSLDAIIGDFVGSALSIGSLSATSTFAAEAGVLFGAPAVIVPVAIAISAATAAFFFVDLAMRVLPDDNKYRQTWNSLKKNPVYTITHAWGGAHADTHITTFDGLYYNFQAAGEFVLARSTVAGDPFQVQIRLQPYANSAAVSIITQAAVAVSATDRLTFDATRSAPVYYDGQALALTNGVAVTRGDATVTQLTTTSWQVQYASGEAVSISQFDGFLNVDTALAGPASAGTVQGLLGTDGGNPANDLMLPNGTVLAQPVSSADLYTQFADAWRVTQQSSLLDYGNGQTTATFTDASFPSDAISLSTLPASVLLNAANLVAAAGITDPAAAQGALEDYLLTGNAGIIAADAQAQNVVTSTLVASQTADAAGIALGVGVVAPAVTLAATSTTTPVDFTIYLTGASSNAETVDYGVLQPGSAYLGAAAFAGAVLPGGSVTIAAGQVSATVEIDVLNTALGSLPGALLQLGITATDATPVAAPLASIAIANAQVTAGIAAAPAFIDASNIGTLTQNGSAWTLDLGNHAENTPFTDLFVDIANAAASGANTLSGTLTSPDGAIAISSGLNAVNGLQPGQIDPLTVSFDTTQIGAFDTQLVFAASNANASGYNAPLGDVTLDITGNVLACFLAGTRILTVSGEIPVEALRVGDLVACVSGRGAALRPIRWIGVSPIDLDRHAKPEQAWPVRILAGAFGPGRPHRDLLVSPDHAIAMGDVLVPAWLLVNGASIRREERRGDITYFHVELDRHDILLAEGLAAESYLDTGNRSAFANGGVVRQLHPDHAPACWDADGCRRLVRPGAEAAAWHADIAARAAGLGFRRSAAPDLHLIVDGRRIQPQAGRRGEFRFMVPEAAQEVRLVSRCSVPNEADPATADRRRLGVPVSGLRRNGRKLAMDGAAIGSGFYPMERFETTSWRWTDGNGALRLRPSARETVLDVIVKQGWQSYWEAPAARLDAPFSQPRSVCRQ
jgi:hypothetical protein